MRPFDCQTLLFAAGMLVASLSVRAADSFGRPLPWQTFAAVKTAVGATNSNWDGVSLNLTGVRNQLRFFSGQRRAEVNGTTIWLNAMPQGSPAHGSWSLAAADLDLLVLAVLTDEKVEEEAPRPLRVLLDAGHGGRDGGAQSRDPEILEKDLTLQMALLIGDRLSAAGLEAIFTRTNDVTIALDERARLARSQSADLFLSLHANHADNADATGIETYVLPLAGFSGTATGSRVRRGAPSGACHDFHSTLLGFAIHSRLVRLDATTPDRGLKRQSFFVLRETSTPSALIELGFLSNPDEARRMVDPAWQARCADAISAGILSYARRLSALDQAIAHKRARDAEAAAQWQERLLAQAPAPARMPQAAPLPAPAPAPAAPQPVPAPAAPPPCHVLSPLEALMHFYTTGHTE